MPERLPTSEPTVPPLLQPLLGVHGASSGGWLADAAATAAERALGALHGLLYVLDASGHLVGERPASLERMRALSRLYEAFDANLLGLRFDPNDRPELAATLQSGRAAAADEVTAALPLDMDADSARAAQRQVGVAQVWMAPLFLNGESLGVLVLLMPDEPPAPIAHAEMLGRHAAVALANLRDREAGRRRGEIDPVRWVFDQRRFNHELTQEIQRAARHDRPVSILVLRVQHLDALYRRYGRFLAERLLRQIGGTLEDALRDTDFLGAYGENGYAAILVEADRTAAKRAKKRLMTVLDKVSLPNVDLPGLDIEIDCVTATFPDDGGTAADLMSAAEARLASDDAQASAAS